MGYQLYINEEWKDTVTGYVAEDKSPADGSVFVRVHFAGGIEVEEAIAVARRAQRPWTGTLAAQKEQILLKAVDWTQGHIDEVVDVLTGESGSTFGKAHFGAGSVADILRTTAGECRRVFSQIQQREAGEVSIIRRFPLGVVAGVAPFSLPLLLALKKAVFTLTASNTFVLKPANATSVPDVVIAKTLDGVGIPEGVFSLVPDFGEEAGNKLIEGERIRMAAFIGSTVVGRGIAFKVSVFFRKYSLEIDDKNPLIFSKDFDAEQVVGIAGFGVFLHQREICMYTSRLIVEEPIYDPFYEAFAAYVKTMKVGGPHQKDTIVGPPIKQEQCQIIDSQARDAVSKGAALMIGEIHEGNLYQPAVLKDVTPDVRAFYKESFGPVTSIIKTVDVQDAVRLCNDN